VKKKTLFLLRKPLDRIDPSLFLSSESDGDLVFLEEGSANGQPNLSYDLLVEKIFQSDYTVVI
jgi:hypothetical protein